MFTPRAQRRERRAFMKYKTLDARHFIRIFQLTQRLRQIQRCMNIALNVAKRERILTVKKFVEAVPYRHISVIQEFKTRVADFPPVFTPAFATPLLTDIIMEIHAEVRAIHVNTPRTEVLAAYAEWQDISIYGI